MRALLPALGLVACLALLPGGTFADSDGSKAAPTKDAIPFKKDERIPAFELPNVVATLVLVALVGWGAAFAIRRFNLLPKVRLGKNGRIRLIETVRLDSKVTLYAVAADDRTLLLARCGEALVVAGELRRDNSRGDGSPVA